MAFAGKGFEAVPPYVVPEAGAKPTGGSLAFHDLPNAIGAGIISGRVEWRCPGFQP
jgi:hypothetical protein